MINEERVSIFDGSEKNRLDDYNQLIPVIVLDTLVSWLFSCELLILTWWFQIHSLSV